MSKKEHLKSEGLQKVINLKSSMNKGSTPILIKHFPNLNPVNRPSVKIPVNLNPNWVAGFVDAEGCFFISTTKSKLYKTGHRIQLNFNIVQHYRDILLMKKFVKYFNCGEIYETSDHVTFVVTKLSDIEEKILPFFNKYPLQGFKQLDYVKFCRVTALMKEKAHLTVKGLEEIMKIKTG